MGRKNKETTIREREIILKWHNDGKSYTEILICRSKAAIQSIIKKIKNDGTCVNKKRTGRPRILTKREENTLVSVIKQDPHTSAPKLVPLVSNSFHKVVSAETCRRVLRRHKFNGRVARKKPYINEKNRLKRLAFAKEHIGKVDGFWESVIFSDESKYNMFQSDGRSTGIKKCK